MCYAGMTRSTLPVPLNMLQAADANDQKDLQLAFDVLAQAIGARAPVVDFADFIAQVKIYGDKYTFWDRCNDVFKKLESFNEELLPTVRRDGFAIVRLGTAVIDKMAEDLAWLNEKNILRCSL